MFGLFDVETIGENLCGEWKQVVYRPNVLSFAKATVSEHWKELGALTAQTENGPLRHWPHSFFIQSIKRLLR